MKFKNIFFCLLSLGTHFLGAASSIAVVSVAIGDTYREIVAETIKNKALYCNIHGYDFCYHETSLDPSRPPAWSKVLALLEAMENEEHKWLFWTDADALFTNLAYNLEDLVDDNYIFIVSEDFNWINTGNFFIRNCDRAKQLLRDMYAHEECIPHSWAEQLAFKYEYEQKPEVRAFTKIIPQRLLNSYPRVLVPEHVDPDISVHKEGDFIIHFASARNESLKSLVKEYALKVVNSNKFLVLDDYLRLHGFKLSSRHSSVNEGYITNTQKKQMESRLLTYPWIRSIADIGLNSGHSADNFFNCCKKLDRFVSFDLNEHPYTKVAVDYFKRKYGEKFVFFSGDSALTVPKYAKSGQKGPFDLIYIDGNHSCDGCLTDIITMGSLAGPKTILWIDDYCDGVKKAVSKAEAQGVIELLCVHTSHDAEGTRIWVEAKYKK